MRSALYLEFRYGGIESARDPFQLTHLMEHLCGRSIDFLGCEGGALDGAGYLF